MVSQLCAHTSAWMWCSRTEASRLHPQHLGHGLAGGKNKVSFLEKLSWKKTDKRQVVNIPLTAYQLNYIIS